MTRRWLTSEEVLALQVEALRKGAKVRTFRDGKLATHSTQGDFSANCTSPIWMTVAGRAEAKTRTRIVTKNNGSRFADYKVPCRKCLNCLKRRAWHWRQRALSEHMRAHRTWMGTLTLDPHVLQRAKDVAAVELLEQGVRWEDLTRDERFLEVDRRIYGEFQKRMDLLRKKSKVPLRYLAVTEAHDSGEPHWHVLLHEVGPQELRYDPDFSGWKWNTELKAKQRVGDPFWLGGFQKWNLKLKPGDEGFNPAEDDPTYVCKYLSKSLLARVRASKGYGEHSGELDAALSGSRTGKRKAKF